MNRFCYSILILLILLIPQLSLASCWKSLGQKEMYGSYEQCQDLQAFVKSSSCEILALSWQIHKPTSMILENLLVYDSNKEMLTRIKVEKIPGLQRQIRWEMWKKIKKDTILLVNPEDGLNFDNYKTGKGLIPLSLKLKTFIAENPKGTEFKMVYY